MVLLSSETKGPGEKGQKSSRNFVSEISRFRVQISLGLLGKGPSTILALFRRRILGQNPVAPSSPGPFSLLLKSFRNESHQGPGPRDVPES